MFRSQGYGQWVAPIGVWVPGGVGGAETSKVLWVRGEAASDLVLVLLSERLWRPLGRAVVSSRVGTDCLAGDSPQAAHHPASYLSSDSHPSFPDFCWCLCVATGRCHFCLCWLERPEPAWRGALWGTGWVGPCHPGTTLAWGHRGHMRNTEVHTFPCLSQCGFLPRSCDLEFET